MDIVALKKSGRCMGARAEQIGVAVVYLARGDGKRAIEKDTPTIKAPSLKMLMEGM